MSFGKIHSCNGYKLGDLVKIEIYAHDYKHKIGMILGEIPFWPRFYWVFLNGYIFELHEQNIENLSLKEMENGF